MDVVRARIIVPFWCSFKRVDGTNFHMTYPFPPVTTLYGLFMNSMGHEADILDMQDSFRVGIEISKKGSLVEDLVKIKKISRTDSGTGDVFGDTLVIRERLIAPEYLIYINAERDILSRLYECLKNPLRPLSIGQNDDFIVISEISEENAIECASKKIDSIIPGIVPSCEIINAPVKISQIRKKHNLISQPFSLPPEELKEEQKAFRICNKNVIFFEQK